MVNRRIARGVAAAALGIGVAAFGAEGPGNAARNATQEDHRQMMRQLGITELRRGADGSNRQSPNYQNTDESRANPWPKLPELMVMKDGTPVRTAEDWWQRRRPEIVEEFDREVYGRVPKDVPAVKWEVVRRSEEKVGEVPVVTKQLVGRVDNSGHPAIKVEIQLTLTTPAAAKGPVPVIMEFGFGGFGFGRGPATTRPATLPAGRGGRGFVGGPPRGPSWQQQVLAKGWGYAILVPNSVQADNGAGLRAGIIGLCNKGQPRKPDDWGALRAWAWGASRALDYLETDPAVDAKKVGIEGLSRYGKAALVTMAYDQRFAIAFVGGSGQGGAKLHRRNFGELVENVASSGEYHWMAGNYLKYAGPLTPGDLPVDAHQLIALCAPRPTFISNGATTGPGAEGTWIDARGTWMATAAAQPAWVLLGKRGVGTEEMPAVGEAKMDGELAWRQHEGGHTNGPNWPTFLEWAGRYLGN